VLFSGVSVSDEEDGDPLVLFSGVSVSDEEDGDPLVLSSGVSVSDEEGGPIVAVVNVTNGQEGDEVYSTINDANITLNNDGTVHIAARDPEEVEHKLEQLAFRSSSESVDEHRIISVIVHDAHGARDHAEVAVHIGPVNDLPSIFIGTPSGSALEGDMVSFPQIFVGANVSDSDSDSFNVNVSIITPIDGDELVWQPESMLIGAVELSSSGLIASTRMAVASSNFTAIMEGIKFRTNAVFSPKVRSISVVVTDTGAHSLQGVPVRL